MFTQSKECLATKSFTFSECYLFHLTFGRHKCKRVLQGIYTIEAQWCVMLQMQVWVELANILFYQARLIQGGNIRIWHEKGFRIGCLDPENKKIFNILNNNVILNIAIPKLIRCTINRLHISITFRDEMCNSISILILKN